MTIRSEPLLKRLLSRYIVKFAGLQEQSYCSLRVSNADGSDMREIGQQSGEPIEEVHWMVDNKKLCFPYHGKYYTVSTD